LLCTYNGSRFLAEQLDSLERQTHQNWVVFVSDDDSIDQTPEILRQYQSKWPAGKLTIRNGPQRDFCENFLSLACDPKIRADYYAFCDQDDVWLPSKLTAAIKNITSHQTVGVPYVYSSRTIYVDEKLKKIGESPVYSFPRTFRNALVQCIAGANTMVFNADCKALLENIGIVNHSSHDWWVYQIVTATGGIVAYDLEPQLLYRQHQTALVGGNRSIVAKIERSSLVITGQFKRLIDTNIEALCGARHLINQVNLETLDLFKKMRASRLKDRMRLMEVCGLYRQTWKGTISLLLAAVLKKI
jgi:glycosyltransferase involved in cell wall biosynthesis